MLQQALMGEPSLRLSSKSLCSAELLLPIAWFLGMYWFY